MSARGEERTAVSGPLHGVRIVTMGGLGPGPFCGMLLAVGLLSAIAGLLDTGIARQSSD